MLFLVEWKNYCASHWRHFQIKKVKLFSEIESKFELNFKHPRLVICCTFRYRFQRILCFDYSVITVVIKYLQLILSMWQSLSQQ